MHIPVKLLNLPIILMNKYFESSVVLSHCLDMHANAVMNYLSMNLICLQGSLSRALGLRPRSEKASPSSSSDTGSLVSQCQYMSSIRSNSPPPPQLPPRPSANGGSGKRHRRVKSIGDIEYITSAPVSTPV